MSNETLLIAFIFINLIAVLGCYKAGRRFLEAYIVVTTVTLYCTGGKLFNFFEFPTVIGVAGYAGIFLATDMLTETYGKDVGYRMIRLGFISALMFTGITQYALFFAPIDPVTDLSNAMDMVFGSSLRIFVASITAYLIAQHFDVWLYHILHERTGAKMLWLRNNLSTGLSQLLDTIIFCVIAFYGVVPNVLELGVTVYLMKLAIAFIDTPFMYLAKRITPADLGEFTHIKALRHQKAE